ncbi:MAG TPA: flagellar hook-length control protein FliK [Alphaproteobacteria bacterium]|nr:flagellar hook-length control protein FliK [Alphaproteobacteria bacterium]
MLGQVSSQTTGPQEPPSGSGKAAASDIMSGWNAVGASEANDQKGTSSRKLAVSNDNARPSKRAADGTDPNVALPSVVPPLPQMVDQPSGQAAQTMGDGQSSAVTAPTSAANSTAPSLDAAGLQLASSDPQTQNLTNATIAALTRPADATNGSLNLAASGLIVNVKVGSAAGSVPSQSVTNPGVQAALVDPANQGSASGVQAADGRFENRGAGAESGPPPVQNPLFDGSGTAAEQASPADARIAASNGSAQSAALTPTSGPSDSGKAADGDGQNLATATPSSNMPSSSSLQAFGPQSLPVSQPISFAQNTAGVIATSAAPPAVEQVAMHIAKAASDGVNHIQIQLSPQNLGGIEVHLDVGHDGHVLAAVSADRPDTLNLLRHDAQGLEQALKNAGLRADAGGLSFSLRDQGNTGYQAPLQNTDSTPLTTTSADSTSAPASTPVSYATSVRPGGVDIQV